MENKKVVTLDLSGSKYPGEIHKKIRTAFDFPQWYGANRDAFRDLLSTDCHADEVIIKGLKTLSKDFDSDIKILKQML